MHTGLGVSMRSSRNASFVVPVSRAVPFTCPQQKARNKVNERKTERKEGKKGGGGQNNFDNCESTKRRKLNQHTIIPKHVLCAPTYRRYEVARLNAKRSGRALSVHVSDHNGTAAGHLQRRGRSII